MLAYVFWHCPGPDVARGEYERRLTGFHEALGGAVLRSATFHVERLPFSDIGGYEDWYLVEDWTALGELNEAAVDANRSRAHDAVASVTRQGWGGVYRLLLGSPEPPKGVCWENKASGESYEDFLVRADSDAIWERQLVLGPAAEFCVAGAPSDDRRAVWSNAGGGRVF